MVLPFSEREQFSVSRDWYAVMPFTERNGHKWYIAPFVPSVAKSPPNPILPFAEKAQATNWLSAPHFFLDRLSEYFLLNARKYWDRLSRNECGCCLWLICAGKNTKNLENFLYFGGKRYSCRSPPNFCWLSTNQQKQKENGYVRFQ